MSHRHPQVTPHLLAFALAWSVVSAGLLPLHEARAERECTADKRVCVGDAAFSYAGGGKISFGTVKSLGQEGKIVFEPKDADRTYTVTAQNIASTHADACVDAREGKLCPGDGVTKEDGKKSIVLAVFPTGYFVTSTDGGAPVSVRESKPRRRELDQADSEALQRLITQFSYVSQLAKMETVCPACRISKEKAATNATEARLARRLFERNFFYRSLLEEHKTTLEKLVDEAAQAKRQKARAQQLTAALPLERLAALELAKTLSTRLSKDPKSASAALMQKLAECVKAASDTEALSTCLAAFATGHSTEQAEAGINPLLADAKLNAAHQAEVKTAYQTCLTEHKEDLQKGISACIPRAQAVLKTAKIAELGEELEKALIDEPLLQKDFGKNTKAAAAKVAELRSPKFKECLEKAFDKSATQPDVSDCAKKNAAVFRVNYLSQKARKALEDTKGVPTTRITYALEKAYAPCLQPLVQERTAQIDDRACLEAAQKALKDPLEPDSLRRPSSFAKTLQEHPEWYSNSFSAECLTFLKDFYSKGKTLYSQSIVNRSTRLGSYSYLSRGTPTDFFHYTDHKAMLDQFHPETSDRGAAHVTSLQDGTYDKAFLWFRQRNATMYGSVLFVAEDPSTSSSYGRYRVTLHLNPEARVLVQDVHQDVPETDEHLRANPGLKKCNPSDLRYLIYEDSGIDLVDYHNSVRQSWFQMIRPNAIERVELKY